MVLRMESGEHIWWGVPSSFGWLSQIIKFEGPCPSVSLTEYNKEILVCLFNLGDFGIIFSPKSDLVCFCGQDFCQFCSSRIEIHLGFLLMSYMSEVGGSPGSSTRVYRAALGGRSI